MVYAAGKKFQLARQWKLLENFTFLSTEGILQQVWVLSSMFGTIDIYAYIAYFRQKCHNSKFGVFELLV